jgi:hypothetical protein
MTKTKKKKLTKVERRIAVVKDAIKQIKLNKYAAKAGEVVSPLGELHTLAHEDIPAQEVLKNLLKRKDGVPICKVCARGALLVSTIHKENDFILSDFNNCDMSYGEDGMTDKRLEKLFSGRQLALIEQAFEEGNEHFWDSTIGDPENEEYYKRYALNSGHLSEKEIKKCTIFHDKKFNNDTDRLLGIFKNIVKNKGIFKP